MQRHNLRKFEFLFKDHLNKQVEGISLVTHHSGIQGVAVGKTLKVGRQRGGTVWPTVGQQKKQVLKHEDISQFGSQLN